MKMIRRLGLIGAPRRVFWRLGPLVSVLLWAGAAGAQVTTVQHVMDYRDNVFTFEFDETGIWFWIPKEVDAESIEDHSPYYRTSNEDWGWMHEVSALVPPDAVSIQSATLTINAWDVESDEKEDDIIYVNGQEVGMLTGVMRVWQTTTFTLPRGVLNDLWRDKRVYVYMDIDQLVSHDDGGYRVTLGSSTLTINYSASGTMEPTPLPVYRFWSPVLSGHFYTISEEERELVIADYPDTWTYETIAYKALAEPEGTRAVPVYRFWSESLGSHFYTVDEVEKQYVLDTYPDVWAYETIAFYAYAPGNEPAGTVPVYRFWSDFHGHHFYTASEQEKEDVIATYPGIWAYETIAWYAYAP